MSVTHECWFGGEDVDGSQYWYSCRIHDVQWSGSCGSPFYANFDPDFAANAPSPA
jgi:hypothetical protein